MNTTSYMDKQIMDLSHGSSQHNYFIDLMDHPQEEEHKVSHGNGLSKKEEILLNYDLHPMRPNIGSFQSPTVDFPPNLGGGGGGSTRDWNSSESKSKSNTAFPIRNYGSVDSCIPVPVILEKDHDDLDATSLSEIDLSMRKHAESLLDVLQGVSEKLTKLESRTRHLEDSVDDLKIYVGNNHGNTDGKMRQLENILRDVQTGVKVLTDKQETVEAQLQLAKMQVSNSKVESQSQIQSTGHVDSGHIAASDSQYSDQQLPPNVPPQPMFQSVPPSVLLPNQVSQNQIPPVPPQQLYYPAGGQTQEAPSQQYQLPPGQQPLAPPTVPSRQQFQPTTQQQYSLPPPQLPQQHPLLSPANRSQLQPTLGHHPEETPCVPSVNYAPGLHQPPSRTPGSLPPSQQYYGQGSHASGLPSTKFSSGFSSRYGPQSGVSEPYHYGRSPSQDSGTSMKPPLPSSATDHRVGNGYPQLPIARVLPHASSNSSGVGGGSGSSGSGNRVPIDDVIDKVTTMGFPRDQVRATVRKLTDNSQAVDLNVVLDKLMNG